MKNERFQRIKKEGSYCPKCDWLSTHHTVCELCGEKMQPQGDRPKSE